MWTKPGRGEMVCIENAGPERQRWVNQSGCPMGAEVNNVNMIGDCGFTPVQNRIEKVIFSEEKRFVRAETTLF